MIWCVEDDDSILDIEIYTLNSTGFEARGFADGEAFFAALKTELPELIILDIMLPGDDGVKILKKLRSDSRTAEIPVIMATAKGTVYDKIKSLDLGADDYLVKPFGMMEMVSRVRAVMRRCRHTPEKSTLKLEFLTLNTQERRVTVKDEPVTLTYKEYELLKLFMENPGIVLTRERIFSAVWEADFIGESRTVDMHIRTLRQKLGECGEYIRTVRNVGYSLEGKVE